MDIGSLEITGGGERNRIESLRRLLLTPPYEGGLKSLTYVLRSGPTCVWVPTCTCKYLSMYLTGTPQGGLRAACYCEVWPGFPLPPLIGGTYLYLSAPIPIPLFQSWLAHCTLP